MHTFLILDCSWKGWNDYEIKNKMELPDDKHGKMCRDRQIKGTRFLMTVKK